MGKYIKLFEEFIQDKLNEGQIAVYAPGNPFKAAPNGDLFGAKISNGMQWPAFYDAADKWLDQQFAITLITSDFIPNSDELGFNKKTTNPKYQSEVNGTWGDKSLPLFIHDHPGYDESEFDLIKVDKKFSGIEGSFDGTKEGKSPHVDGVFIQDKDGNEFCIHASRILDVQLGSSVRDQIYSGTFYMIDKMRARIVNYQKGIVTVSFKSGSKDPDDFREYTLKEWKEHHFHSLDESETADFNWDTV